MSKLTVIVVIAGGGQVDDLQQSRSLIQGDGTSWIERICGQVEFADKVVVVHPAKSANCMRIDNVASKLRPDATTVLSPGPTAGTACSALLAVDHVDPERELLLLTAEGILDIDFPEVVETFRARGLDAGTIVFPSLHRRFYYASVNARDLVEEVSEKRATSRNAVGNLFWWRRAGEFIDCAIRMIRARSDVNGRFDIGSVLNEMIMLGKLVGTVRIDGAAYHLLSTGIESDGFQESRTT